MKILAKDNLSPKLGSMLEGFDCPAILVSPEYQILATNHHYLDQFGQIDLNIEPKYCYKVSHGYDLPCDQSGEDCPLSSARESGHKARVLHVHQTPRGREHVDVEMIPILDDGGSLICFVELLKALPSAGGKCMGGAMVGCSDAFNAMLEKITRVSQSQASVLLLGESGTGKELAAKAVHCGSPRQDNALVSLECAGLTDSLFESELFGYVKGAFTGANSDKKGLVELADGGTLFLDEIGDVPLGMQVKLLRLLESGTYRPVGSATVKNTNFRLVCATHKNLKTMVEAGDFREDLYYRINVFPIRVPPLRERKEDLPRLVSELLKNLSPKKELYLTNPAMQLVRLQPFPGNIRELRNLLSRAVVLTDTNLIDVGVMQECLDIDQDSDTCISTLEKPELSEWVDLKTAEQKYIRELMAAHGGDKDRVAEIAGISVRSLYRKLDEIG